MTRYECYWIILQRQRHGKFNFLIIWLVQRSRDNIIEIIVLIDFSVNLDYPLQVLFSNVQEKEKENSSLNKRQKVILLWVERKARIETNFKKLQSILKGSSLKIFIWMVCLELHSYKHHRRNALQTVAYDKRAAQINYFVRFYNLTLPIEFKGVHLIRWVCRPVSTQFFSSGLYISFQFLFVK